MIIDYDENISYLRHINKAAHTPEANAKRRESLRRRYKDPKHKAEMMRAVAERDKDGKKVRR